MFYIGDIASFSSLLRFEGLGKHFKPILYNLEESTITFISYFIQFLNFLVIIWNIFVIILSVNIGRPVEIIDHMHE